MERPYRQPHSDDGRRQGPELRLAAGGPPVATVNRIASLAHALHSAADDLEHERHPRLGEIGHRAADELERLERHLDRRDVDAIVRDALALARRNPALFLGGLFAGGVAFGRVVRRATLAENRP